MNLKKDWTIPLGINIVSAILGMANAHIYKWFLGFFAVSTLWLLWILLNIDKKKEEPIKETTEVKNES